MTLVSLVVFSAREHTHRPLYFVCRGEETTYSSLLSAALRHAELGLPTGKRLQQIADGLRLPPAAERAALKPEQRGGRTVLGELQSRGATILGHDAEGDITIIRSRI